MTAENFRFEVTTHLHHDSGELDIRVDSIMDDVRTRVMTSVIRTQEKATRDALIALGWKPPTGGDYVVHGPRGEVVETGAIDASGQLRRHEPAPRTICDHRTSVDESRPRSSADWRRLTGLWRYGVNVLPPTATDFYAWLGVLDAAIDEKAARSRVQPSDGAPAP